MNRIIFAVVSTGHEAWDSAQDLSIVTFDEVDCRSWEDDQDQLVYVPHENFPGDTDRQKNQATENFNTVLTEMQIQSKDVYAVVHERRIHWNEIDRQKVDVRENFTGQKNYPVFRELCEFSKSPSQDKFDEVCEVIEKGWVKNLAQKFGTTKHRISQVLIPVEVDLQGWREYDFEDSHRQEIEEEYMVKVCQRGREPHLIKEVKRLVYSDKPWSLKSIVHDAGVQNKERWFYLTKLLPKLSHNDPSRPSDAKKRFDLYCAMEGLEDTNHVIKKTSGAKKRHNLYKNAKKPLKKLESRSLNDFKHVIESKKPFHEWLNMLEKDMNKMKEIIEGKIT